MGNPEWLQFIKNYIKEHNLTEEEVLRENIENINYNDVEPKNNICYELLAKFIVNQTKKWNYDVLQQLEDIIRKRKPRVPPEAYGVLIYEDAFSIYNDTSDGI
jgi:hypothetical protein